MGQIRQFIHFIPLKDCDQPCMVSITRQYSRSLAERQAFHDFHDKEGTVLLEKMCTKEITVDEDGTIRLIEEERDILRGDIYKP
jgi:hypothetical protein